MTSKGKGTDMQEYIGNTGQTYHPFKENLSVPELEFEPLGKLVGSVPELIVTEEFASRGYEKKWQVESFLPNVTAEMIDWFWANMEKCYYLWAPGSHKSFRWIKEPWKYGHTKAELIISETFTPDTPVFGGSGIHIYRMNMDQYPFYNALKHVNLEATFTESGELSDAAIDTYENVEGGVNHIRAKIVNKNNHEMPTFIAEMFQEFGEEEARRILAADRTHHSQYEAAMWTRFLPAVYNLWKGHPDPSQNVSNNLEVLKNQNDKWVYKYQ